MKNFKMAFGEYCDEFQNHYTEINHVVKHIIYQNGTMSLQKLQAQFHTYLSKYRAEKSIERINKSTTSTVCVDQFQNDRRKYMYNSVWGYCFMKINCIRN